jgi:pimeloyl-ACP methyl ester carboxylesterase
MTLAPLAWTVAATLGASGPSPGFVRKDCPGAANARLVCGTVTVPESRSPQAGGRTIELNVVVVKAETPRDDAVPLFHLEGGPGVPATPSAGFYLGPGGLYARARDVVLVDQRGTGGRPVLRCPSIEGRAAWDDEYAPAAVDACRGTLEGGASLSQYSTENAAADVDAVREALGYQRLDIWALSYGTRLAQVYLERFPARVHAAVLAGFAPLDYRAPLFHARNAQRVLDLLFQDCARDADCHRKYPELAAEWQAVLRRFDAGRLTLRFGSKPVEVRRGPFGELVRNRLGTAAGQRSLPRLIHAAAQGDWSGLISEGGGGSAPVAEGVYLTIVCSEAEPRIPRDSTSLTSGTFLGAYRVEQERAACANWPRYPVPDAFYAAPPTGVPILVLSGAMDHVTAPDWAHAFCADRKGCTLVSIPGLGHGPFDLGRWQGGECFDRLAAAFLLDPTHVDATCVAGMRPPAFE